jgi:ketosteroid isomerase-like protein
VTLFGAVASSGHGGWEQVTRTIHMAVSRFTNGTPLNFELMAAEVSGGAGLHGRLRTLRSVGQRRPLQPTTLRITHIYRREHGDWKLMHRHGDHPPINQSPPAEASTP